MSFLRGCLRAVSIVELPPQVGETETSKVLKLDQDNADEDEENKADKANNLNIENQHFDLLGGTAFQLPAVVPRCRSNWHQYPTNTMTHYGGFSLGFGAKVIGFMGSGTTPSV
ncbi:hypothetical protein BaRGS_00003111 [Batillaria attramentaria]|uniref:Uncharacterized protein n=1 Tax=Batillaria attramentaria TaxID=370345 RepID=A0ABD0M279_9CAEN